MSTAAHRVGHRDHRGDRAPTGGEHPAGNEVNEDARSSARSKNNLVRISIGVEDADDLVADVENALRAV